MLWELFGEVYCHPKVGLFSLYYMWHTWQVIRCLYSFITRLIHWELWLEHKSQKVIITFNKNALTYTIILNGPFQQINQPHADNNVCLPSQAVAKFNICLLLRRNNLITELAIPNEPDNHSIHYYFLQGTKPTKDQLGT